MFIASSPNIKYKIFYLRDTQNEENKTLNQGFYK